MKSEFTLFMNATRVRNVFQIKHMYKNYNRLTRKWKNYIYLILTKRSGKFMKFGKLHFRKNVKV